MQYGMPWPGTTVAREAEKAGVSVFCSGEFVDHEAYTTLAEMVASTETALVGPAIAYAFARSPYAHAAAIRSLWKRGAGRMFLGLGSGAYRVNRDWFGVEADHPVDRMADLVGAVRAWLHAENGSPVRYSGPYYRIDADVRAPVLGRLDVPILIAGFNRRMAAAAGRVADGIIGHGLFTASWWNDVVRPALDDGARSREAGAVQEHGWVITAVNDDDPARAELDARRMIAFYLTVRTYDPLVAHHGWEEPVAMIRAAFRRGDTSGMAAAVTQQMLAAIAVCGTTGAAREALVARGDGLARDVSYLAPPSFLVSDRRRQAYARAALSLIPGSETAL